MIEIKVSVTIQSSVKKVWDLFTDSNHIVNWNFANNDWHCPIAVNDLRVGGEFSYRMEAKSGEMGFDFGGIYDEIIEFQKIRYHLGDDRSVEVIFEEDGENTVLNEKFEAKDSNSAELQRQGWQAILNNFKSYVEKNE